MQKAQSTESLNIGQFSINVDVVEQRNEWIQKIIVYDCVLHGKIDTGAQCNVMSYHSSRVSYPLWHL